MNLVGVQTIIVFPNLNLFTCRSILVRLHRETWVGNKLHTCRQRSTLLTVACILWPFVK